MMVIHVVSEGETVLSIAQQYGVSETLLRRQNLVPENGQLVVGQTLVILFPTLVHTVSKGDTLFSIAQQYGVSVRELYQNNYFLSGRDTLAIGEEIVVEMAGERSETFGVNGYAYPFISPSLLRQELPYLSYLTPFTYGITAEGNLVPLSDEALLSDTRNYEVQPWMHLSTLTEEGNFSSQRAAEILTDPVRQELLIAEIIVNMQNKGYGALDVDFEFLGAELAQAYADFIARLRGQLNPLGYPVIVALAPKTYAQQPGVLYEGHEYAALGAAADAVLLMTYEWGYTYGPPMAVAPLPQVRRVLEYALTEIPPEKIFLGIPTYGYDWPLPYERGVTKAESLSPEQALTLARNYGVAIQYDEVSQAPFFRYLAEDGREHEVWFEDARSVQAKLELAAENRLQGLGLWNLMRQFPQFYLLLNAQYNITLAT